MCTPDQAAKIRAEVGQWMQRAKLFTSVDIANSLKQRGDWIRNRDVADYLRANVVNISPQYGFKYDKTIIDVQKPNGSYVEATLYFPVGTDPKTYSKTAQKALSPDEAKGDSPFKGSPLPPLPTADETEDEPSPYRMEGLSASLKEFTPRSYQIVNIHIAQVANLFIGGDPGDIETTLNDGCEDDFEDDFEDE